MRNAACELAQTNLCMKTIFAMRSVLAQWQSFNSRLNGHGIEIHRRHYIASFSKSLYPQLSTVSTQEDDMTENLLTGL